VYSKSKIKTITVAVNITPQIIALPILDGAGSAVVC